MRTDIDIDKLARLQTAADMRLFRLRGLEERIREAMQSAAEELARAQRDAAEVFAPLAPIESVIASLTAELARMNTNGGFHVSALADARARIEAARRCATHRARVTALTAERDRLQLTYHAQGRLMRALNTYAEVQQ